MIWGMRTARPTGGTTIVESLREAVRETLERRPGAVPAGLCERFAPLAGKV
jgi:hypothetical protein